MAKYFEAHESNPHKSVEIKELEEVDNILQGSIKLSNHGDDKLITTARNHLFNKV